MSNSTYSLSQRCRDWIGVALLLTATPVLTQESFRVELGGDGETIGDMRPVFLTFESRPMPAISPEEVARRYQRLFDSTNKPEVRIDALNRLVNIQHATGHLVQPDVEEEQRLYREALGSYEAIVERGAFQGKLDELLYQMAKAHAYVGQGGESIQRLKQLVGLYPESALVPEARFRIAESAFSAGRYVEAEAEYGRLIAGDEGGGLKIKARYMQGWSQFRQGAGAWTRSAASFLEVLDQPMPDQASIARVADSDLELVDDTLRVLALMAAETDGADALIAWLSKAGSKPYDYLLFDRLADYYASKGRHAASVAVNQRFVELQPGHMAVPAFMAQVVEVWRQAGEQGQARRGQAAFVAAFEGAEAYQRLDAKDQALWRTFGRELADYHYSRGQNSSDPEQFARAAEYYERLGRHDAAPGDIFRLAGDARLQSGDFNRALTNYRQAAYDTPGYRGAADAAWAAVVIQRDGADHRIDHPVTLEALSDEAEQFEAAFRNDARLPALYADLANRWLEQGELTQARRFAERVHQLNGSQPADQYIAWLVLGEIHTDSDDHRGAENAWRKADRLIQSGVLKDIDSEETRAVKRQLAAAIYRQGEAAQSSGDTDLAVAHFQRVDTALPGSDIAIKGRYDAANSLLLAERWQSAVNEFTRFRGDFPEHQLSRHISDKLVLAYESSDQPVRAALELMEAARSTTEPWQSKLLAAEYFHRGQATARRNAIYQDYLAIASAPSVAPEHLLLQRMRQRLIDSGVSVPRYRQDMVSAELASQWHSEDTLRWSAGSALALGISAAEAFGAIPLNQPLQQSLSHKQQALELATQRFSEADQFDQQGVRSETLYRRAELYRILARDLMNSAVPDELNDLEQAQYRMLLEEEAYPFEEKAINLHARNHQLLPEHGYNEWVEKSLNALAELFPGRYDRDVRWMTWTGETNDDA